MDFKSHLILESKITPKPIQNLPDSPAGDTWSQYRAYLAEVLPQGKNKDVVFVSFQGLRGLQSWTVARAPEGEYALATKGYLIFAESILRAYGATPPEGKQPATGGIGTQTLVSTSQGPRYICWGDRTTSSAPVHLKVFYDELYEACWKGNDDAIRELCLPKQVAEGKQPIQIVVRTTTGDPDPYHSGALLAGVVFQILVVLYFFNSLDAIPCRSASPSLGYCTTRACHCQGSVSATKH
jgi:hypothetical protein